MDVSKLIKGKAYQFNEPCTGNIGLVVYQHETINHYVFVSEIGKIEIPYSSVISNVIEIPKSV